MMTDTQRRETVADLRLLADEVEEFELDGREVLRFVTDQLNSGLERSAGVWRQAATFAQFHAWKGTPQPAHDIARNTRSIARGIELGKLDLLARRRQR